MERVIITGCQGFIGSAVTKYFLNQDIKVLGIDLSLWSSRWEENFNYLKCNVRDTDQMADNIPSGVYDTFIHLAWIGSSGEARKNYDLQLENVSNTIKCLKLAKKLGCKRFVCAGSIMEYEVEKAVHGQGTKPSMGYTYGTAKYLAHCMCKYVATEIGIDLIWPMITNAYGPGERSPRLINTTLKKIIHNEPLEFTSATQNYDFVYIDDVARAFYMIADKGHPFCEYIIGTGHSQSLRKFLEMMIEQTKPDIVHHFGTIPFTGTDLPKEVFNTEDTLNDTGFQAKISFQEGIAKTYNWLKTKEREEEIWGHSLKSSSQN